MNGTKVSEDVLGTAIESVIVRPDGTVVKGTVPFRHVQNGFFSEVKPRPAVVTWGPIEPIPLRDLQVDYVLHAKLHDGRAVFCAVPWAVERVLFDYVLAPPELTTPGMSDDKANVAIDVYAASKGLTVEIERVSVNEAKSDGTQVRHLLRLYAVRKE